MSSISKIESTEYADLSRVLKWFITLRWIASAGVVFAIIVGRLFFSYYLPPVPIITLTSILVLCNAAYSYYLSAVKNNVLSRSEMSRFFHVQTIFDYIILFLLVYFTGYVRNPFVYFFVFHMMLTSFIFPNRIVVVYVVSLVSIFILTSVGIAVEIFEYYGLFSRISGPTDCTNQIYLPTLGIIVTLGISAFLITNIRSRIAERGARFELELDRYKSLDKAKSNFILQVTHELRGPLAALKGYHEMILKGITGEIPPRTTEMLERADQRTRNLLNIIDEMIDFAYMKSEADIDYSPTDMKLTELLRDNADVHSTMAKQKGVHIHVSVASGLSMRVNRDLINIILGNLITNAIRYSKADSRIILSAEDEGGELHFTVQDSGIGIAPDDLDRIFEEFYRSRRAREIERDGTGLGLSIVQKAVNLLGGRISVYSEVDRGTSFHVYFPKTYITE